MKLFITLRIVVLAIIFLSCSSGKKVFKTDNVKFVYNTPPGTVKIDSNFYADKTETTNISYREYVFWNKRVFGYNSSQYLNSLLDTTLLAYSDTTIKVSLNTYFLHNWFRNYPVVGISYDQACNYAKWRSERVMEMYLIKNKIIESNHKQDSATYFSIEKYFAGQYMNYEAIEGLPVPNYRLPTKVEWGQLASFQNDTVFGIDKVDSKIKKASNKGNPLFLTKEHTGFWQKKDMKAITNTCQVQTFTASSKGLYDMIGNVAEMISEPSIAKGGSWKHSKEESAINKDINYSKAENWLGFRCVCSWENYPYK